VTLALTLASDLLISFLHYGRHAKQLMRWELLKIEELVCILGIHLCTIKLNYSVVVVPKEHDRS